MPQVMCHPGRESQLTYILNAHKTRKMPRYCIRQHDSAPVGPFKAMGILLIGPSLKAVRMLLILVAQTSG